MERFTMGAAGRVVAVSALYASTRDYCSAYLCTGDPDFEITITEQDIDFEREKAVRESDLEGLPVREFEPQALECTAVQRKIAEKLFTYDTLLFHGSVVAVDGEAYLFTAKSGTGKSTHVGLWRWLLQERAVIVNDDKPFLWIEQDGVTVYGSPWNGKHGRGNNIHVPLKAICLLERGAENEIRQIPAGGVLPILLQQSNRPMQPGLMPQYMELLDQLSNKVAFYRMACNISAEAPKLAYETMSGKMIGEMNNA